MKREECEKEEERRVPVPLFVCLGKDGGGEESIVCVIDRVLQS